MPAQETDLMIKGAVPESLYKLIEEQQKPVIEAVAILQQKLQKIVDAEGSDPVYEEILNITNELVSKHIAVRPMPDANLRDPLLRIVNVATRAKAHLDVARSHFNTIRSRADFPVNGKALIADVANIISLLDSKIAELSNMRESDFQTFVPEVQNPTS